MFLGMGIQEIFIIMLVAFLVLGPAKTMNMAKGAGKILGEVRRSMADISKVMDIDPQTMDFDARNQTNVPGKKDPPDEAN